MIAQPEEVLHKLDEILRSEERLYERLCAGADILLKLKLHGKLTNKYTGQDIVHSIFEKLSTGDRKWNKEKYPDLLKYFRMCIKSYIYNLAQYEERLERTDDFDENNTDDERSLFMDDVNYESLENILSNKDKTELKNITLELLKDDEEAAIVFISRTEEMPNQEIAEDLGITVREVEAAIKRIKRKTADVFEKYLGVKIPVRY